MYFLAFVENFIFRNFYVYEVVDGWVGRRIEHGKSCRPQGACWKKLFEQLLFSLFMYRVQFD